MELKDLKNLIALLKETDITDLQVEKDGSKVRIRREKFFPAVEIPVQRPAPPHEVLKEAPEDHQRLFTVTSPIVGTFYRSPTPEAPSFVDTGTKVKKGQVLCIIEAMKLMNEIECEVDGIVAKALVENGQPVEYGEPLFLIEPL